MRLSDTDEIQSSFRREVDALLKEIGVTFPLLPEGIIDGKGLSEALGSLQPNTLQDLGFRAEHVRVLKTLALLLGQCGRVEPTEQNLKLFEHLFHPAKPTTPAVADAYEEVVMAFQQSIGPNRDDRKIVYLVRRVPFPLTPSSPRIDKISFRENRDAATPLREDDDVEALLHECEADARFDWHIDRNSDPRGPIIFGVEKR